VTEDLAEKYRPRTEKDLVGQPAAAQIVAGFRKTGVQHQVLLTGPSGVGKTTVCHILRRMVGCYDKDPTADAAAYRYVNMANNTGIDFIRQVTLEMRYKGLGGRKAKVWIFDECHRMSGEAQDAFLIPLENPGHNYFFLSTTEPPKVKATIKTRCSEIRLGAVSIPDLKELVKRVCSGEGVKYHLDIIDKIAEKAEGSPRRALKLLQVVMVCRSSKERMAALDVSGVDGKAFELVKELMPYRGKPDWFNVAKLLEDLKGEDPEGIRQLMLAVCRSNMLKGGAAGARAFKVYSIFEFDFDRTKHPGLCAACWKACFGG
jgi:replication-associated recombination protein RarA